MLAAAECESQALTLLSPWPMKVLVDSGLGDEALPDWVTGTFPILAPGHHTLQATFTDSTGTARATSDIEIVDLGGNGFVRNVIIVLGDGMGLAHRTAA